MVCVLDPTRCWVRVDITSALSRARDRGLGVASVLPTASSPDLLPVAAPSTATWTTELKPSVMVKLPADFFVSSAGEITLVRMIESATVPVNLKLGHTFGDPLVIAVGPSVVVEGPSRGDVTIEVQLNYLWP